MYFLYLHTIHQTQKNLLIISTTFFRLLECNVGDATWKDRWEKVDWHVKDFKKLIDDKQLLLRYEEDVGLDSLERLKQWKLSNLDVWATRFVLGHVLNDAKCICPVLKPLL